MFLRPLLAGLEIDFSCLTALYGFHASDQSVGPESLVEGKGVRLRFGDVADHIEGIRSLLSHKGELDLLVQFSPESRYWVNPESPRGYFAARVLQQSDATAAKQEISGAPVRYVDWVLPGVLGMNMMFSCLFGVGYVIVRYRKNGFLKRLRATPLTSLEFITAQIASRMLLIMLITSVVYTGTHLLLDTRMEGSYATLFLVGLVGAISLVSLGLVVSARVTSEELAGGLLNLINWPMMLLSGVWFSLEGTGETVQAISRIFPLTHVLESARAVILDGATLAEVAPSLGALLALSAVFLAVGAAIFRWEQY